MEKRLYKFFLKCHGNNIELKQQLTNHPVNDSNLESRSQKGSEMKENISIVRTSSYFPDKQKLQYVMFSEGICIIRKMTDFKLESKFVFGRIVGLARFQG